MIDIALKQTFDGFDLAADSADLITESGLKTSIIISLFTDRRVEASELPEGETDRRGWFGDAIEAQGTADPVGSRLWLLSREKQTDEVLSRAEEYCKEALQWLLDDGIAKSVEVAVEFTRDGLLGIAIQIQKPSGEPLKYQFARAWDGEFSG